MRTPFRQPAKPKEQLLPPEQSKAYNEALGRQVRRAELSRPMGRHRAFALPSIPWKYVVPVVVGALSAIVLPRLGLDPGRSLLIGVLSALALFAIAFVQDVNRWLSK